MSKKLLMNYSENGLMPVTDGLIGWYDAKYRSDNDEYLIDRSGNENDISCNSINRVLNSDNIDIIGASYSSLLDYSAYINKGFTILYYIDTSKSSNVGGTWSNQLKCMCGYYMDNFGWWICPNTNNMNIWYKNKKIIDDNTNTVKIPKEKIMIATSFSSTKTNVYMNGVLLTSNIFDNTDINRLSLSLFGDIRYDNTITYRYYSSYIYI